MHQDCPPKAPPVRICLTAFTGSHEETRVEHELPGMGSTVTTEPFGGASWTLAFSLTPVAGRPDALDGLVTIGVVQGEAREVAVALEWRVEPWSRETFVMLPGAAYNGNRYPVRLYPYPPMVHEAADIGPEAPLLISDVPRLNREDGAPSRLQVLTGDLTTPCISYFDPRAEVAVILLTEQGSPFGTHGLTVEESLDRSSAILRVEAPGVRRDTLYTMVNTATPSWDRAARWTVGSSVTLRFRLFVFRARTVQALYDRFADVREDLSGRVVLRHGLPFSAAWRILEEKYQRDNWCEAGYYRVGTHEAAARSPYQDWQVGWVGGGMVPFPMLIAGSAESRQRALLNLDWMFARAQHPNGLFHAGQSRGEPYGDGFGVPGTERWYMVRKQADALYFLIKACLVLQGQEPGWQLPAHWNAGTRRLADRLVAAYRTFGQLGQYLDCETGDVVVGGSTAAAMAPGALALAGQFLGHPDYIQVAEALARQLDARDVQAGVTTGGPGEILKCPDSESAFAMLESFVVLHEVTGDASWMVRAEAMATQCLTWCASYDFVFPQDSWFGKLDMHAAGSVWANVQNKHSAPGLCTLSGDSLFKLFRHTGRRHYLDQIRVTAHNMPQYLSRADRPVGTMKPGWMCERVNFSDWEGRENIGGSLFGSCWCEVSLMLTTVELPGLYVQPDTGLISVFDHLDVLPVRSGSDVTILDCHNPTSFDAEVRVFAESSVAARSVLGQGAALRWPTVLVPAGETRRLTLRASPVDTYTVEAS